MHRAALGLSLLLTTAQFASAHTLMVSPTPRSDSDGLKTGPCGNVPPGQPSMLETGSTLTVSWLETVDHPGYYRIAFSPPGDAGFEDDVLLDRIADEACSSPPCSYSAEVTLPAEPCEGCALQLIQFMGTGEPYSPYFSCADVTLVDPLDPGDPGADPNDPGAPTGGVEGTCSAGGHIPGGGPWLVVAAVMVALRPSRRSRSRS